MVFIFLYIKSTITQLCLIADGTYLYCQKFVYRPNRGRLKVETFPKITSSGSEITIQESDKTISGTSQTSSYIGVKKRGRPKKIKPGDALKFYQFNYLT